MVDKFLERIKEKYPEGQVEKFDNKIIFLELKDIDDLHECSTITFFKDQNDSLYKIHYDTKYREKTIGSYYEDGMWYGRKTFLIAKDNTDNSFFLISYSKKDDLIVSSKSCSKNELEEFLIKTIIDNIEPKTKYEEEEGRGIGIGAITMLGRVTAKLEEDESVILNESLINEKHEQIFRTIYNDFNSIDYVDEIQKIFNKLKATEVYDLYNSKIKISDSEKYLSLKNNFLCFLELLMSSKRDEVFSENMNKMEDYVNLVHEQIQDDLLFIDSIMLEYTFL